MFPSIVAIISVALTALATDTSFTCSISTTTPVVTVGERPNVKVVITNVTGKEVYLVGCLDGSDSGGRFPKCSFQLLDMEGNPIPEKEPRIGCGSRNRLKTTDFVKVAPGAEFTPYGQGFFGSWELFRFSTLPPGDYVLRFHYQTSTKDVQDYFGDEKMMGQKTASPEIQKLYEAVPLVDVKSNDLRITVRSK